MEGYLTLVVFAVVGTVKARNSVNGTIEEETNWFLSNLSVRPAMTAYIVYHIRYQTYNILHRPPIITFYYEGQNSPNIQHRCNAEMHGQLFNQNLAVRSEEGCFKSRHIYLAICINWTCEGRIKIQDFEPKLYFFSLGFKCNEGKGNLNGLKYEVTMKPAVCI